MVASRVLEWERAGVGWGVFTANTFTGKSK
jgi:hypothetical protein